jgi:hypothetical protein
LEVVWGLVQFLVQLPLLSQQQLQLQQQQQQQQLNNSTLFLNLLTYTTLVTPAISKAPALYQRKGW